MAQPACVVRIVRKKSSRNKADEDGQATFDDLRRDR